MNPEQLTASFELCKRLDELGVKIDSYFYMHVYPNGSVQVLARHPWAKADLDSWSMRDHNEYPAPTVAELLDATKKWKPNVWLNLSVWQGEIGIRGMFTMVQRADNPADALALCICEAVENKHITAEEINNA